MADHKDSGMYVQAEADFCFYIDANIRVSKDTLDRTGHTSIPFGDGDGYYAQLGMVSASVLLSTVCIGALRQLC